jgi:hypothetical protein
MLRTHIRRTDRRISGGYGTATTEVIKDDSSGASLKCKELATYLSTGLVESYAKIKAPRRVSGRKKNV